MLYVGVDHHKRYVQVSVLDERGTECRRSRVPTEFDRIENFVASLGEPCIAVLEAGWNWGLMYDWLAQLDAVREVQLAHPTRTRAIAAAKVKTDAIDAHTLAQLLRAGLIPQAYIPAAETRRLREFVRQRVFLVRMRTRVKNRIHALLDRHHVPRPAVSDLFGKAGRTYLGQVQLPDPAGSLVRQDLRLLEQLNREVKEAEGWLQAALGADRRMQLLLTVPGLGQLLGAMVALEIDDIHRFARPQKLAAYGGLVPSTRASGGRVFHGRLITQSNRWLRWALIEAAWVAVRRDPYFRQYFAQRRHKGPQTAIVAVARRLSEVIWHVLTEQRSYEIRPAIAGRRT